MMLDAIISLTFASRKPHVKSADEKFMKTDGTAIIMYRLHQHRDKKTISNDDI